MTDTTAMLNRNGARTVLKRVSGVRADDTAQVVTVPADGIPKKILYAYVHDEGGDNLGITSVILNSGLGAAFDKDIEGVWASVGMPLWVPHIQVSASAGGAIPELILFGDDSLVISVPSGGVGETTVCVIVYEEIGTPQQ